MKKIRLAKSFSLLLNFIKYCKNHPNERFWQALRNWSEADSILIRNGIESLDTFYWEERNK